MILTLKLTVRCTEEELAAVDDELPPLDQSEWRLELPAVRGAVRPILHVVLAALARTGFKPQ